MDDNYPRPQLVRERWVDLGGRWNFRFDDADIGLEEDWRLSPSFDRTITVPFPPESSASGIGDTGFHRVAWYHRELTRDDLAAAGFEEDTDRLILHFGAVDYRCTLWLDGRRLGSHEGGHTPFSFDITTMLDPDRASHTLVVRTEDDPHDLSQPRGKQDWQLEPHAIWYHRTSGIWQPVWLEAVPEVSIDSLQWTSDLVRWNVTAELRLSRPAEGWHVSVSLSYEGEPVGEVIVPADGDRIQVVVPLTTSNNAQASERLLWWPEQPRLLDAVVTLLDADAEAADSVDSYVGLRTVGVERGAFLFNDRTFRLRAVLSQGFWPSTHLAAPSADALRAEVQLILDLGFNTARLHQKIEDPRFLYWADRLGLLVWAEMPSAYEFTPEAIRRTTMEWLAAVERDRSHPCVVTWVPVNESWGVQHIAGDEAMRHYVRSLYHLTKALDPTRPVISNDGWEHLDSDLWTVHDYESSGEILGERYADADAVGRVFDGMGPTGHRLRLTEEADRGQPVVLSEFGGIRFTPDVLDSHGWGYSHAASEADFSERLGSLIAAARASRVLAGFCYTQLTDTMQEANGLVTEDRVPKLPLEHIRAIITGRRP